MNTTAETPREIRLPSAGDLEAAEDALTAAFQQIQAVLFELEGVSAACSDASDLSLPAAIFQLDDARLGALHRFRHNVNVAAEEIAYYVAKLPEVIDNLDLDYRDALLARERRETGEEA